MPYRYRAFGLEIASELALPELRPGEGDADVWITSSAPREVREPARETKPGHYSLAVPGIGTFDVDNGTSMSVAADPAADAASVRLFVLGSAMGALLHQRGIVPLHGAALRAPTGYLVVVGVSGAGKSSLAAALREHGWAAASDDISAVTLIDNAPVLIPGYPASKMWPDVLALLGKDAQDYERVRPAIEKRAVPIERFDAEPGPIACVLWLTHPPISESVEFDEIRGGSKMTALKQNMYRPALSVALGSHGAQFPTIARLADVAPMWRVNRPRVGAAPHELARRVLEHAAETWLAAAPGNS